MPAADLERTLEAACEALGAVHGELVVLGPGGDVSLTITVDVDDRSGDPSRRHGHLLEGSIEGAGDVGGRVRFVSENGVSSPRQERCFRAMLTLLAAQLQALQLGAVAQRRNAWLKALNDITGPLIERRPTAEVLRNIARGARELTGADVATVATATASVHAKILVADGAHAEDLEGAAFPFDQSLTAAVLAGDAPVVVDDVSADPRTEQPLVAVGRFQSALLLPLRTGTRRFGTLAVANLRGRGGFDEDDCHLLGVLAQQASLVLDYQEEERRALAERADDERERIASDLQESAIQRLLFVCDELQRTAGHLRTAQPRSAERLLRLCDEVEQSLIELRRMVYASER